PSNYERTWYYNGIAGEGGYPEPRHSSIPPADFPSRPVKSVHGIFDIPLKIVWPTIVQAAAPNYSCVDVARFYTQGPHGFVHNPSGTEGSSLGPVTIWVGVPLGPTS
ncbi:hypothetical protein BD413DRAFT_486274, partial [Trametes elegans]